MHTPRQPRRLELELQLESQPIHGWLYDRERDGRVGRAFSGWLGLMAAIDAACRGEPAPPQKQREEAS